jgi:hypothetical protein
MCRYDYASSVPFFDEDWNERTVKMMRVKAKKNNEIEKMNRKTALSFPFSSSLSIARFCFYFFSTFSDIL